MSDIAICNLAHDGKVTEVINALTADAKLLTVKDSVSLVNLHIPVPSLRFMCFIVCLYSQAAQSFIGALVEDMLN